MKVGSTFMSAPIQKSPDEKLHEVSDMYEKHFLREMLKSMRSTIHEGGFVQANQAEKIFREQLDDQYVDKWGEKGGIGLSNMIYTQLIEKYGVQMGIKNAIQKPQGPLPMNEKSEFTGHSFNGAGKKDSVGYKFDRNLNKATLSMPELGAPAVDEKPGGASPVSSPWSGKLLNKVALNADENVLEIGHDNGLKSQLVYRGSVNKLVTGQDVQAGEVVGYLSPQARSLFWNVQSSPQESQPSPETHVSE